MSDKIVYKARVETNDGINELSTKVNFGISETEFTTKYKNHIQCHLESGKTLFKLSKFLWSLKDQNKEFDIKWFIF